MGAQEPLDLSDMPRFEAPAEGDEPLRALPEDLGLLAVEAALCFSLGFVGFLRYDVR